MFYLAVYIGLIPLVKRVDPVIQYLSSCRLEAVGFGLLSVAVGQTLLGLLPHEIDLLLVRLEEETHPVGVVVHGEVGQPGTGVGVYHDLVTAVAVDQDGGASHGVLVVVLVVLVKDGGDFLAVPADGEEGLLVVVGGDVEDEEVSAAGGGGEDAGLGVHAATSIGRTAL